MQDLTITQVDNTKSLFTPLGSRIRILLKENPTTGYRWKLHKYDSGIIRLQSDEFVAQQGTLIGGSGIRQLCFLAATVGRATIELRTMREWEKPESVLDTFVITINVERNIP